MAALGLMGIVASGCAGALSPVAPPAAPSAMPPSSDAYQADVEALARTTMALTQHMREDGAVEAMGYGTRAENYDGALYEETEPLASMMTRVSAEELCDKAHIQCYRDCMRVKPPWPREKNSPGHKAYCSDKCLKEYVECMKKAGLMKEFSVMSAAMDWINDHAKEITIGTLVVIGVVVYVVVSGGSGALTLAVLPAVG